MESGGVVVRVLACHVEAGERSQIQILLEPTAYFHMSLLSNLQSKGTSYNLLLILPTFIRNEVKFIGTLKTRS